MDRRIRRVLTVGSRPMTTPCPHCKGSGEFVDFGAQIKAARIAKGMSQNALAVAIGVHHTTIIRLERGSTLPHPRNRRRLVEVLELNPCPAPRVAR